MEVAVDAMKTWNIINRTLLSTCIAVWVIVSREKKTDVNDDSKCCLQISKNAALSNSSTQRK